MKQNYMFLATFLCCNITLFAQTSVGNVGTAVIGVHEEYKNDLWLNTHYREMNVGESTDYSFSVTADIIEVVANAPLQPAEMNEFTLEPETFLMAEASVTVGETTTETFSSGSFAFKNNVTNWGGMTSWYGVAISNQTDNTAPGSYLNQYNSAAGGDVDNTGNYGVVFDANSSGMGMGTDAAITFSITNQAVNRQVSGCYVTNNTYVTSILKNGDGFTKKFGGQDGNDPDYFKLTATGTDMEGNTAGTLDFYLADFRFEDNSLDYIVEDWKWFDLTDLGSVASVTFSISSSDVGDWGMNTPACFCIDNLGYQRLKIITSLKDVNVKDNEANMEIDLSDLFADAASLDNVVVNTVQYNSNIASVSSTIVDNKLILDFVSPGTSTLIVKGNYKGMSITDTMTVEVAEDKAPYWVTPIDDVIVEVNATDMFIDISERYTDLDDDYNNIITSIQSNSNPALVTVSAHNDWITLKFTPDLSGEAVIVVATLSNGKTVTETFTVTVSPTTSVGEPTLKDMVVYPNPSNGIFRIQTQVANDLDVQIFSVTGRQVYANPNYSGYDVIDISKQAAGQYIIKLNDGTTMLTKLIIVR